MKVFIRSKHTFDDLMVKNNITNDNVESKTKSFFISINDTLGTSEKPYFENKNNVKVLFFDDVLQDVEVNWPNSKTPRIAKAFTEEQAKELFEFIQLHRNKETCIVHCAAGISRSGAVGTFINDFTHGDFDEFKRNNPHIHPNSLVLKLLKDISSEID